jgi:dual specificity tyrosine-phosphorylation-regulated kinase 2/3/4
MTESEYNLSRSASATSSLDPYYFGLQSPSDSPIPPFPAPLQLSATPEMRPLNEPVTPARDPAAIDRRGLVGVGELSTPRWAQAERDDVEEIREMEEEYDLVLPEDAEQDGPDSPWTIEAIDGESDEKDEVSYIKYSVI